MTTLGGKTVARADAIRPLQSDGGPYYGIGQVANEDTVTRALIVNTNGSTAPSLAEFLIDYTTLYPAAGNQTQYQNVNNSTDPAGAFVSCPPFPVTPTSTVPGEGYACDAGDPTATPPTMGNTVGGWVGASFTQPAVGSNVQVTFVSPDGTADGTAWLSGLTADATTGSHVYITGGGVYRLVSVDSATQATFKNLGIAAAIVSLTYT